MLLTSGKRLGPYEILSAAGAGGMGEVYRARDTRLERTVAVKVLPERLSTNPDLRQRFEREARAVASLAHPHICTLHDIGHQDGVDFLVLEYLEGETLDRRLGRGPLAPEELPRVAVEIAEGLEHAHRHGIIHRDLKPGNIMLTKAGAKLLDFGLAKLSEEQAPLAAALTEMTAENRKLTQEGTILGTFQYMAPEQLEGTAADARSDIFAFGSVLYEMATGKPAFSGRTKASLIAAILSAEPKPPSALAPMTPPALDRVVKTCLAKDPEERFQTAHDLRLQLQWIIEAGSQAGVPAPVATRRKNREKLAWAAAGVLFVLAGLFATGYFLRAPRPAAVVRSTITLPPKSQLDRDGSFAISPDGRRLAFVASSAEGKFQLWVRPLDSLMAQPLEGTEEAIYPFWSADSRYIGFFAEGKLKKIDASGGPAQTICEAEDGRGGSWNRDGVIVFAPGAYTGIYRVPAAGGTPTAITTPDTSTTTHRWPMFLPDGKHFLFLSGADTGKNNGNYVAALDSKGTKLVVKEESNMAYADPGFLVFVRERNLMALPFDARSLGATGDAVPIAEQMRFNKIRWFGSFSISGNGALLYQGGAAEGKGQLTWLDREGKKLGTVGEPVNVRFPVLSPDGSKAVADVIGAHDNSNLWMFDTARGVGSRFTFSSGVDTSPVWSPDGRQVVFTSNRGGSFDLYIKPATGAGNEQALLGGEGEKYAEDWSRDGRFLVYRFHSRTTKKLDIWILPMTGERKPYPFLETEANELDGAFSPDGRWLVYSSDESGRLEIYVVPFPGPGGKWQVSTSGGLRAWWNDQGTELMYLTPDLKIMSVEVKGQGSDFVVGTAHPLLGGRSLSNTFGGTSTRDAKRFLLAQNLEEGAASITLVTNWIADLKK